MSSYREKIEAEIENINKVLLLVPKIPSVKLSELELAGTASILHSFYNGIENILKQLLTEAGQDIPRGNSWHKMLLKMSVEYTPLENNIAQKLLPYLAFRHFFNHAYALDLDPEKMDALLPDAVNIFNEFIKSIKL